MGTPKALVHDESGTPWVVSTARTLRDGGCTPVVVVVGAAAAQVRAALAGEDVDATYAADWSTGMGASLRAGLTTLATHAQPTVAVVAVVDTPDLPPGVVRRLLEHAEGSGSLVRATYDGLPGHPVVLGARHFSGIIDSARGDVGARDYLRDHPPVEVECADLARGTDVDVPEDLPRGHRLG